MRKILWLALVASSVFFQSNAQDINVTNQTGEAATITGGQTNVPIFVFSVDRDGAVVDVTDLTVTFTNPIAGILANLSLVRSDDATFGDGDDVALGSLSNVGGNDYSPSAFTVAAPTNAGELVFFVVADIDPFILNTSSISAAIAASQVVINTAGTKSGSATGPTYTGASITELRATISEGTGAVSTAIGAQQDRIVLAIDAVSNGSQSLSTLNILFDVDITPFLETTQFELKDGGSTVGTATYNAGTKTVSVTGIATSISSTKNFKLIADVKSTAPAGSFKAEVAQANVTVSQGYVNTFTTFDNTVTVTALNATFSAGTGTTSSVIAGNNDQVILSIDAVSNGTQNLTTLVFDFDIDITPILETTQFELKDGVTTVGTAVYVAGTKKLTISGINTSINPTKNFKLIADVEGTATGSFQVSLPTAGVTANQGGVNAFTTISNTVTVATLSATFTAIAAAPVIAGTTLEAGSNTRVLAGFSATSNGTQLLSSINFNLTGLTTQFSDISLYRSTNATVGSAILTGDADGNFDLTSVAAGDKTINSTTVFYYLVVNVGNAVTAATSTVRINPTETNVIVATGNKNTFTIDRTFSFNTSQTTAITIEDNGQTSIDVGEYDDTTFPGLTNVNSQKIFGINITDADTDNKTTNITSLTFEFTNSVNLAGVALFDGATKLTGSERNVAASIDVNNRITFSGLTLSVADGSAGTPSVKTIDVRVTFNASVTDNQVIAVSLFAADDDNTNSGLATFSGIQTVAGDNDINVVATNIKYDVAPSPILQATDFALTVRGTDTFGNQDVNATTSVELSLNSGGGTLTSVAGLTKPLVGGVVTFTQLQLSTAGAKVIRSISTLTDADLAITVESLGIQPTGPVNQQFCIGGTYQVLNTIALSESDNTDFAVGTNVSYSIILPTGFEFNTAITPVLSETGSDITSLTVPPAGTSRYPANNIFRFTYTCSATATDDQISVIALQVRYTGTTAQAALPILRIGGSAVQVGNSIDDQNSHGTLRGIQKAIGGLDFIVDQLPGDPEIENTEVRFNIATEGVKLIGNPVGGTFSGNGVIFISATNEYQFKPSIVGNGNYLVTYTYKEPSGEQCQGTISKTLEVYSTAINNLNRVYCKNSSATGQLSVLASGIPPGSVFQDFVYWDRDPVTLIFRWFYLGPDLYSFNPASFAATIDRLGGFFYLGYRVKPNLAPDDLAAAAYNWETLRIFNQPNLSFSGLPTSFCQDDAPVNLIGTPTPVGAATFSGTAVSGSVATGFQFTPANVPSLQIGVSIPIQYSFTQENTYSGFTIGCTSTTIQNTIVHDRPTIVPTGDIISGTTISTCKDVAIGVSFGGAAISGTQYRWYTENPPTNLKAIGNTFNPNGLFDNTTVGNTNFYVTRTINGCESTQAARQVIVAVSPPAIVNAGTNASICAGDPIVFSTTISPTPSFAGSATSATWSVAGMTGQFTDDSDNVLSAPYTLGVATKYFPSAAEVSNGSVIFRLTTNDPPTTCVAVSDDVTISVNTVATANPGLPIVVCSGDPVRLNGSIAGAATSLTWSENGAGTLTSTTTANTNYLPTLAELQNGAIITFTLVTNNPPGPCSADSKQTTVTINRKGFIDAGPDITICAGEEINLNGSIPSNSPATDGIWSLGIGANGTFSPNNTDLLNKYVPSIIESSNGAEITLILTSSDWDGPTGPCGTESDEVKVTLYPIPSAPLVIQPDDYCVDDNIKPLEAFATGLIRWYGTSTLSGQIGTGSTFPPGVPNDVPTSSVGEDFYATQVLNINLPSFAGCESPASQINIVVNPLPQPLFEATQFCEGEFMEFNPSTSSISSGSIVAWGWDFRDGTTPLRSNSGPIVLTDDLHNGNTTGTYGGPLHKFPSIGSYNVSLTALSDKGCSKSISSTDLTAFGNQAIRVGPYPKADFRVSKICDDELTEFEYGITPGIISSRNWNFGDPSSGTSNIVSFSNNNTVVHNFIGTNTSGVGSYSVSLLLRTDLGCEDDTTKMVSILPYVDQFPYTQSFELDSGEFVAEGFNTVQASPFPLNSWQIGTPPAGSVFTSASDGNRAWFAHNSAIGSYNNLERSVLNSPCFNLNEVPRPVLTLDGWMDTDNADGAYVEVSTDGGENWGRLGDTDEGANWYNTSNINGLLRLKGIGQVTEQKGWSGITDGWVNSRFSLSDLSTQTRVRFRIVFGSNPDNPASSPDGMGVDNFGIRSRNRTILAENFTNLNDLPTPPNNNTRFNGFNTTSSIEELVKIQYHTSIGGTDPIHDLNKTDPNARAAFYGVTQSYKGYIDGNSNGNFANDLWATKEFNSRTLADAPMEITINPVEVENGEIVITSTVELLENIDATKNYALITAIIQQDISVGVFNERFVLRKFLPSASGKKLKIFNESGTQLNTETFDLYGIPASEYGSLAVIVLVQEVDGDKAILQSKFSNSGFSAINPIDIITGVENSLDRSISIYPNPSHDNLEIRLQEVPRETISLTLIDQFGKNINAGTIEKGNNSKTISVKDLADGMYILLLQNNELTQRRKVMVVHK